MPADTSGQPGGLVFNMAELSAGVAIKRATKGIARILRDAREFEGLRVVKRRMPAAVRDRHRVFGGNLIQVVNVELALVPHFSVVIELTFHPEPGLGLMGFRPKFLDDGGDADELYLVGVAYDHFIKQHLAGRVIMAVNETGHDGHTAGVNGFGTLAAPGFGLVVCADSDEASIFHRKRRCRRHLRIDGVYIGVEHD